MTNQEWNKLGNGEKAWKLGLVMQYMNDEDAYYSGWLYVWPDGETYRECLDDFDEDESYQDLERSFINHYSDKECHEGGLYSNKGVPSEVVDIAHYWDKRLGLDPIVVLKQV